MCRIYTYIYMNGAARGMSRMGSSNVAKGHETSCLLDICFRRNAATPSYFEIDSLSVTDCLNLHVCSSAKALNFEQEPL